MNEIGRGVGPNGLPPSFCTDDRHDVPCPLPCSACEDECDVGDGVDSVLYRICTEAVPGFTGHLEQALAAKGFSGCTLLHGSGLWDTEWESSAVVEIVGTLSDSDRIRTFARQLGQLGSQDSVLVQTIPLSRCEFIPTSQHSGKQVFA